MDIKEIKAILFDFDGTLADTAPGIVNTMQETFKTMQLPVPTEEAIRQTIGLKLEDGVKVLGRFDDATAQKGVAIYRELFMKIELSKIQIFPEVKETLTILQQMGIRMAICTSRGLNSLNFILTANNMNDYFEEIITASANLPTKPAPDMVFELLKRMNLTANEVLVVGDTTFDIEMGHNAGCKTIAVTYGNHSTEILATSHPTYIIDHFNELLEQRV